MQRLGDFVNIKHGYAFKGDFISNEENQNILVTPGNFEIGGGFKFSKFKFYHSDDYPKEFILLEKDLIVTMTDLSKQGDTLGYPALVPILNGKKFLHNQRIGLVQFNSSEIDKLYLYFLMRGKTYRDYVLSTATGTTVKHTAPKRILDFQFILPTLDEQSRIVNCLLPLEEKIQLNTQTNQTLEQIAQTIFKSWFIDFDPIHAKIHAKENGENPTLAAMQAISGENADELHRLQTEKPTQWQELAELANAFPDEIGEDGVPVGWSVQKIEDVIQKIPVGKKYSSKTVEKEGKVPVLDQGKSGLIGYHNDTAGVNASIENPVIVFANHTCYMRLISYDFSAIQNVFAFKGKETNIYWTYLATLGKQEFVEYKGHFPDFLIKEIIVPDVKLTEMFGKFVKENFSYIAKNDEQNQALAKTRDELLPRLLSGEI